MESSSGSVVQPVRTLLSNRDLDVGDLKISRLKQITSDRPVSVPSTFPAFPEDPVRSLSVPSRTGESDVEIARPEAVANAIIHGNHEIPENKYHPARRNLERPS